MKTAVAFTTVLVSVLVLLTACPMGLPETYTVVYDGNGATIGTVPATQTKSEGVDLILAGNSGNLARTGHIFAGWNTQADGDGTDYAEGAVYSVDADLTLYAQWTAGASSPIGTLLYVPGGTYQRDENPQNTTTVRPFYMSTNEITQAQYVAVTGKTNPSYFTEGEDAWTRPVERVNWYDALVFCNMLSIAEGKTPVYTIGGSTNPAHWGEVPITSDATWDAATMNLMADGYRLPTEAECMWAAMGATSGHDYPGSGTYTTGYLKAFAGSTGSNSIGDYAWYWDNSGTTTHPVGTKLPNELGLYDMSGNVWERSWDWYEQYPSGGTLTDPTGPSSGSSRVIQGSSWNNAASVCAVAGRYGNTPNNRNSSNGFRVVSR